MNRLALGVIVLTAAADVTAQPRDPLVDLKASAMRRATHAPATSILLTTFPRRQAPRQAAPPANLDVPDDFRSLIETMWQRSPTFARQCARLAQSSVQVTLRLGMLDSDEFRALSTVTSVSGRLKHADVQIDPRHYRSAVELVAHELEHVIEQLDGVDLAAQITRGTARRHRVGHYETLRAVKMGRRVAEEVRRDSKQRGNRLAAERR